MGEYEPDDSRNVTLGTPHNPIEPERTGPREAIARDEARDAEKAKHKKDRFAEAAGPDGDYDDSAPSTPVTGRPAG
jgi:hypothetical protein